MLHIQISRKLQFRVYSVTMGCRGWHGGGQLWGSCGAVEGCWVEEVGIAKAGL